MIKTINIGTLFFMLLSYNGSVAQEKIDKRVLDESCSCIKEIDLNLKLEAKNDSIKSCITSANLKMQILNDMSGKNKKVLLENGKDSVSVIIIDKDFEIIQKELLQNCPYLKHLLMSDNEKFKNSVSDNKKALDFYQEGQKYSEEEKYDLAIVEYNKAVKKDPKFAFAWDNMGVSYRKLGRYKEAINCYKKSLELDPKGTVPLQNMAAAYNLLKDFKSAGITYEKLIAFYPENPEGFYGAGRMFFLDDQKEKGLDYIFQAYLIYKKTNSPYIHDSETVINEFYSDMKEKNQLDQFQKIADKYNIKMN